MKTFEDVWFVLKNKIQNNEKFDIIYEMNELEDSVYHQDPEEFYFGLVYLGEKLGICRIKTYTYTNTEHCDDEPCFIIEKYIKNDVYTNICTIDIRSNKYIDGSYQLSESESDLLNKWLISNKDESSSETNWHWILSLWRSDNIDSKYFDSTSNIEQPDYTKLT